MKHAYLIISHDNFYTLERLLKMLDDEHNDIFIHLDRRVKNAPIAKLKSALCKSKLEFTKRIKVYWGHSSQVDCELILLEACLKKGNYDFVHLLSGVDLPIQPKQKIADFFKAHPDTQFLQVGDASKHLYRLDRYHLFGKKPDGFGAKNIEPIIERILKPFNINRLKKLGDMEIIKTSNWFSLSGKCAQYVLSQKQFIKRLCRHTVCADEMFLGTVIFNSPYKNQVFNFNQSWNGHMRFIDRINNEGSSPHTFTVEDKERIARSDMLFARKFNENKDKEIIDWVFNEYC